MSNYDFTRRSISGGKSINGQDFDGGAGSRFQATREVALFWYPTWLCYPAGILKDSRLVDAPAERLGIDKVLTIAKDSELIVIYMSTPSINNNISVAEKIKDFNKLTVNVLP